MLESKIGVTQLGDKVLTSNCYTSLLLTVAYKRFIIELSSDERLLMEFYIHQINTKETKNVREKLFRTSNNRRVNWSFGFQYLQQTLFSSDCSQTLSIVFKNKKTFIQDHHTESLKCHHAQTV